jgi:putative oxidoreductase
VIPTVPSDRATRRAAVTVLRDVLDERPLAPVQFAMRIGVGAVFFKAGLLKLSSVETTVALFRDEYQVPLLSPELAAQLAMVQELALPPLLFVGLATRLAVVPLLGMLAVIQMFVYPNAWTEHLVWGSILLFLLLRGPGAWSVDALLWRRSRQRAAGVGRS